MATRYFNLHSPPLDVSDLSPLQVSVQMEQWAEEYQRLDVPRDMTTAELMLSKHNDLVQHVLDTMFQLVQEGQETSQVGPMTVFSDVR